MSREKGTPNTPQVIIDEIAAKHKAGATRRELTEEYGKPLKTGKNMITREKNKIRRMNLYSETSYHLSTSRRSTLILYTCSRSLPRGTLQLASGRRR